MAEFFHPETDMNINLKLNSLTNFHSGPLLYEGEVPPLVTGDGGDFVNAWQSLRKST